MKPYGMKRAACMICPDKVDIANMGAPSRFGSLKPCRKAASRRLQARAARRAGKVACADRG